VVEFAVVIILDDEGALAVSPVEQRKAAIDGSVMPAETDASA